MPAITRRTLGALALAALAASPAAAADRLKVGYLTLVSHSPSFIAQQKGYFREQGLEVEMVGFQAAQPMAVAIASRDVDVGVTAITAGLISLAEKGVIRVIGGALQEVPGVEGQKILVSKAAFDAGVKTPADLRGRSFGNTTAGSSFHYMAHKIADAAGIPRDSIRLVPMQQVPAVVAALKSGQVDAWSIVPNIASGLTQSGEAVEIGRIADVVQGYQVTTVFTSKANTEERRPVVERFLAAFSKGVADYNAAFVDRTMPEAEAKALVGMIHKYVFTERPLDAADPAIRAGAMRINEGAALNVASVKDQLDWFQSESLVPRGVTLEMLVDTSFVKTF
jgi:NitT/TauT family transport system substrate-binding protein